ncbi:hypothetical protein [Agrococcus sp. Marseille-Q4369]|uniref:hypothetical protein n=1 Tax=Agrococcus sp. Marseille-Q4369 TaxID=2810513 RepID=UPI001B8B326E|nr:hypothetical protein [Agrococcus sp. Marseille-Q4369]QUW18872.1 hypothetical protein JSQ78_00350 [Agrococcus sp. Marseille-Q4369]
MKRLFVIAIAGGPSHQYVDRLADLVVEHPEALGPAGAVVWEEACAVLRVGEALLKALAHRRERAALPRGRRRAHEHEHLGARLGELLDAAHAPGAADLEHAVAAPVDGVGHGERRQSHDRAPATLRLVSVLEASIVEPSWFDWLSLVVVPSLLGGATLLLSFVAYRFTRSAHRIEADAIARAEGDAHRAALLEAVAALLELVQLVFKYDDDAAHARIAELEALLTVSTVRGAPDALAIVRGIRESPMPLETVDGEDKVHEFWRWGAMNFIESVAEALIHDPDAIAVLLRELPQHIASWDDAAERAPLRNEIVIGEASGSLPPEGA